MQTREIALNLTLKTHNFIHISQTTRLGFYRKNQDSKNSANKWGTLQLDPKKTKKQEIKTKQLKQ